MTFLEDLAQRRGKITVGGNPNTFVELTGGVTIPYMWHEPDPATARVPYYYNTRINVLFKQKMVLCPDGGKSYSWYPISHCHW